MIQMFGSIASKEGVPGQQFSCGYLAAYPRDLALVRAFFPVAPLISALSLRLASISPLCPKLSGTALRIANSEQVAAR